MKKQLGMSAVVVVLALMAAGVVGCGGSSDSSPSGSGTTIVTNGTLIVTNVTPAASLTGSWNGSKSLGESLAMHLTQTGDAITGDVNGHTATGSISGDAVTLTYTTPGALPTLNATTVLSGNAISSRNSMAGNFTEHNMFSSTNGTWSASK